MQEIISMINSNEMEKQRKLVAMLKDVVDKKSGEKRSSSKE